MSSLPFEILRHTFAYLGTTDCQLTCKNWYAASVELLYLKVDIVLEKTSSQYVRTISNNHRLGVSLKEINTRNLFQRPRKNEIWDRFNLMGALAKYCPYLLKFESHEPASDQNFVHG